MPKNRIIYQSEAIYAGPSAIEGVYYHETGDSPDPDVGTDNQSWVLQPKNLQRVQNVNYSFDIARTDVNCFGTLANIDRVVLESPTVSMDFSYYLADFSNENALGFSVINYGATTLTSAVAGMLDRTSDERNYYVRVVKEGQDAVAYTETGTDTNDVIGLGNGFMASYTSEASVGDFPTVSCTVEALNIAFDKGVTGNYIPKIDPVNGEKEDTYKYGLPQATKDITHDYSVIRPGDITLDLGTEALGATVSDAKIQSYSLSFDLAREPLAKLGSKFAFAREMTFPVTVTLSVDALLGDLTTGNLSDVIGDDANTNFDLAVNLKSGDTTHIQYLVKNCKLDGQAYSSSIGDNKTVTLNFSSQIGSAQQDNVGLFLSGKK